MAFVALGVTHSPFLALPFYWDELGQFIPAALDIYHRLAWVPYTTVPNVHPPGVMAYLALVWKLAGFSIPGTRLAMLALAAGVLVATWKLSRRISESRSVAWLSAALLFLSPLFVAQAQLAQLDMPAAFGTTVALLLFLDERSGWCALACCAAAMLKETALVAPALFGLLLLLRQRYREAFLFVLPLVPVAIWLGALKSATGHWFGSPEFTDYNLFYPLHPVRLGLALLRRGYYLMVGSGFVVGTAALVVARRRIAWARWRVPLLFTAWHLLVICVLGGAVLERYLLPVLPIQCALFAAAIWAAPRWQGAMALILAGLLVLACFVNPLYPFPMENNLAWTHFVRAHRAAAAYLEKQYPGALIATSFPMAGALRRPEMGYVQRPARVVEIHDFRESNLSEKVRGHADVLAYDSILWDPLGVLRDPWWVKVLADYYGYVPQAQPSSIPALTGFRERFRACSGGQCVIVFAR